MKHRNKVKLARKLRLKIEIKEKIPIFQSDNWEQRKEVIKNKVANKIKRVKK